MKMPKDLKIDCQKKNGCLKRQDYLKYHENFSDLLHEVYCRSCGALIKGLKGNPSRTYEKNGKKYVLSHMVELSEYAEIQIEFEDGSRHITTVCKSCLKKMTMEKASHLYASDLLQWDKEGWIEKWDYFGERKINGFRDSR